MPSEPWPRPTPGRCADCGSSDLEGLGPTGNWDGFYAGGVIYTARCCNCGTVWTRYAWGLGSEPLEEIHWGKEGSDNPPRVPESATINPALQVSQGQILWGTVVNVAPFGLFIEVAPRLDGLLLFDRSVLPDIAKGYQKGQRIKVEVKAINLEHVKVELDLSLGEAQVDGVDQSDAELPC